MLEHVPLAGGMLLRAARGGPDIVPATLARFFVLHVAILPIALFTLLAFHFWLVRKVGGVVLPDGVGDAASPRGALVPTSPALTRREGVAALAVTAAVLFLAAVADAPLLAQANPGLSPNPAKAPWYFMGVQELLVHLHPLFGAVIVPALALALVAALPSLGGGGRTTGRWFGSTRGGRTAIGAAVAGAVLAAGAILVDVPLRRAPPWFPALAPAEGPVGFQPQGTGSSGFRQAHGATLSPRTWGHPGGEVIRIFQGHGARRCSGSWGHP